MNNLIKALIRPVFTLPVLLSEKIIDTFYPPVNFYDNINSGKLELLRENFPAIQKEVIAYVNDFHIKNLEDIIPGNDNIPSAKGAWKAAPLRAFNRYFEKPLKHCPVLYKTLKQIDNLRLISISKLAPQSSIKPHNGAFGGFIRAHLAIKVPAGDTALIVGGERREWKEGEFLFFNDRKLHTAYNNTTEDRIIFLMDIERPLPFPLNLINSIVVWMISISPFFRQIIKNADAD